MLIRQTLFIGGPWDGRRESIDVDLPVYRVAGYPVMSLPTSYSPCALSDQEIHPYYVRRVYGEPDAFVAMHTSVADANLTTLLLNGYHYA